jgi:hypothetical protein
MIPKDAKKTHIKVVAQVLFNTSDYKLTTDWKRLKSFVNSFI